MTPRQHVELLCGLGALVLGLLLLLLAYLQPSIGHSPGTGDELTLQPGFIGTEVPYIMGISLPVLGVVVALVVDSLHRSARRACRRRPGDPPSLPRWRERR